MSDKSGTSTSDLGLKIKVMLDDAEARTALNTLVSQQVVKLQFNTDSLAAIKTQLEELSQLKLTSFANDEALAQFEAVKQGLTEQVKTAEQLKQAYENIKIPADVKAYNRQQNAVYKEALAAQKQIQEEQRKMSGLTGEELAQRQAVIKDMETALANLKSQITDQQLLNRLASQQALGQASNKAHAQEIANAEKRKQQIKEEEQLVVQSEKRKEKAKVDQEQAQESASSRAKKQEVLAYKLLTKFQNASHQTKLKLISADEQQAKVLNNYLEALDKSTERTRAIMERKNIRNEDKETELSIDRARKLYEIESQRAKLSDQSNKKTDNKTQISLYQEASKLQKQLFQEQSKLNLSVGDELKARQGLIGRIQEQLTNVKSLITDEERLKKLETERSLLQNKNDGKAIDQQQAEQKRKLAKEEREETKRVNQEQRDAYNFLFKAQNQLHQLKLRSIKASEDERAIIEQQKQLLASEIQLQNEFLTAKNLRSERADKKIIQNDEAHALELERQITAEKERQKRVEQEKGQKEAKDLANAEKRVQLVQQEFEIKEKQLLAGRNGEYVNLRELERFRAALAGLSPQSENLSTDIQQLRTQFRGLSVDANVNRIQQTGGALSALGQSFQNLTRYVTGAMLIRRFFTELREGVDAVKQLDSAMATLRMTMTEFTEHDISRLIDHSVELSKSLKTNISDVLEAVKTVANAGETAQTIMNKSKAALIINNLSGVGVQNSINMIQSATRQFDDLKDASEASTMAVADSMVAISKSLGMDFAEGIQGMSEGLTILGSVANQFGMDLNQTLAMLASTAETTRASFSEVATALKTIMARTMRIGSLDSDVTMADMLKTEKALASIGIAIRDYATNEMRDFNDIIEELAVKFETLDEATQSYVADAMGGAQRLSVVFAMIGAQERSKEMLEIANNSAGTALETQAIWAESLEAKYQELQNSAMLFWQTLLDRDSIDFYVSTLTNIINGATTLMNIFGAFPTFLFGATTAYMLFNKQLRENLTTTMAGLIPGLSAYNTKMEDNIAIIKSRIQQLKLNRAEQVAEIATLKAQGASTATATALIRQYDASIMKSTLSLIGQRLAIIGVQTALSFGIAAVIPLVISGFKALANNFKSTEEKANDLKDSMESFRESVTSFKSLALDIGEFGTLSKQLANMKEDSEDYEKTMSEVERLKASIVTHDSKSEAILNNQKLTLEEQLALLRQMASTELRTNLNEFEKKTSQSTIDDLHATVEQQVSAYKKQEEALAEALRTNSATATYDGMTFDTKKLSDYHKELGENLKANYADLVSINSELAFYEESGIRVTLNAREVSDETKELLDVLLGVNNTVEDVKEDADDVVQTIKRTAEESQAFKKAYVDACKSLEDAKDLLKEIKEDGLNTDNAAQLLEMFDDFTGNINDATEVQSFLNDKIREMADAQSEAYTQMFADDKEFWEKKYKDSEDWKKYVADLENEIVSITETSLGIQEGDFAKFINAKGGFRDVDLSNVGNLLEAQEATEKATLKDLKELWRLYYVDKVNRMDAELQALIDSGASQDVINKQVIANKIQFKKWMADLNAGMAQIENFQFSTKPGSSNQSYISGAGSGSNSSSSSSSSSSSNEVDDLEIAIDRYYELSDALNDVEQALKKNQALQKSASPTKKIELMKEEIKLYKQQADAIKAIYNEQKKEASELKKKLQKQGFSFDENGDITNYGKKLLELQKKANALTGERKSAAIEATKAIMEMIEQYDKLNNQTIPESQQSYLEMMDTIKEAEKERLEYIQDVQDKISDAIKERLEKEAEETKKHIEKMRDLYNSQFEEENYESDLRKENRKLDELKQQIANLSRDTSLAGQLKLQQLLEEYEAQQEVINNMIRDKEQERGDQAFQDALDQVDEKLEENLSTESLAKLVNQALSSGFIKLNGEVIKTENLLTEMLENSGDLFKSTGQLIKKELIDSLKVAQGLMKEVASFSVGSTVGRSIQVPITPASTLTTDMVQGRSLQLSAGSVGASSISLNMGNLMNIEGNLDHTILGEVQTMLDQAQTTILHTISRALKTK